MNKYYLYSFNQFYNHDKICITYTSNKLNKWDLIMSKNEYLLVLWTEISFQENYNYEISLWEINLLEKKLLDSNSLQMINHIVYHYYTTYKNVVPLYLWNEIETLINKKTTKNNNNNEYCLKYLWKYCFDIDYQTKWTTIVLLPDLWTIKNCIIKNKDKITIKELISSSTINQKINNFWLIKNWYYKNVFISPAWLFYPRKKIEQIIIIDSHKWYYKNQQDPRYNSVNLCKYLGNIHNIKVNEYWLSLVTDQFKD